MNKKNDVMERRRAKVRAAKAAHPRKRVNVRVTEEEALRIAELYEEGVPVKAIAEMMGCSKSTVNRVRKDFGLRERPRSTRPALPDRAPSFYGKKPKELQVTVKKLGGNALLIDGTILRVERRGSFNYRLLDESEVAILGLLAE